MADTSNSPLLPTGSLSRSNCAGPSDEHRQDEQSRPNRPVEHAKICVAAARRAEITDEMMPFDQHASRQRYTRLRCRRNGIDFDSLTPAAHHDPRHRLRPTVWELRPPEFTEHKAALHGPFATFLAGRRRGYFVDSVERANICAGHARASDASGPATPYMGRCKLAPTTAVRPHTLAKYPERFRAAYGHHRSRVGTPRRSSTTKTSAPRTGPHRDARFPVTVTTEADTIFTAPIRTQSFRPTVSTVAMSDHEALPNSDSFFHHMLVPPHRILRSLQARWPSPRGRDIHCRAVARDSNLHGKWFNSNAIQTP